MNAIRFGFQIPWIARAAAPPAGIFEHIASVCGLAERSGFDSLWAMDHMMIGDAAAPDPLLEAYTLLGAIAARTTTARLGTLVTAVTFRNPALVAKMTTTLDVISGGRAMLGIGAGNNSDEHHRYGVPFPPIAERLERLEETLQICLQMWSADDGPYEGKHYRLAETLNVPQSLQRPHPPIMIGGGGERKLLRLVAKYADANNLFPASPEEVQHKLDVLARHCEEVGRDRSEIRNTTISRISADTDVDEFVENMARYAALGFEHVQLGLLGEEPAQLVERSVAKLVPRLAEL